MAKAEQVRQRLRRAAMQVLAETGSNQVNVSELAKTAGVARGTVYNNMENPAIRYDDLSEGMAQGITDELTEALSHVEGPAEKISVLVRLMLRKASDDPIWTAFILRFVMVDDALKLFWARLPAEIVADGCEKGIFSVSDIPTAAVTSHMGGAVLLAMFYVHNKQREWQGLGEETARLSLQSLGMSAEEAIRLSACPLPETPPLQQTG